MFGIDPTQMYQEPTRHIQEILAELQSRRQARLRRLEILASMLGKTSLGAKGGGKMWTVPSATRQRDIERGTRKTPRQIERAEGVPPSWFDITPPGTRPLPTFS